MAATIVHEIEKKNISKCNRAKAKLTNRAKASIGKETEERFGLNTEYAENVDDKLKIVEKIILGSF